MWAMMPMLRTRSSSSIFGTPLPACVCVTAISSLPPVVGEGLVGLRHSVDVVLLLVGAALLIGGVEDLRGELLVHLLLAPLAGEGDEPAHCQGAGATLRYLDGHLVVGAADAAGAHLEHRSDRLDRPLEHLDGAPAGLLADRLEGLVDDLLGARLLAVQHHAVDHLGDQRGVVDGVAQQRARGDLGTTWHQPPPFFAPYLERACLRSFTPEVSRAARMILYRTPGRSLTRPPRMST